VFYPFILKVIICGVNVQHDCIHSACDGVQDVQVVQANTITTKTRKVAVHKETTDYVLNMFSLHNYQHIKMAVPAHLQKRPVRDVAEIEELRQIAALQVREIKKARSKAKDNSTDIDTSHDGENPNPMPFTTLPGFQQNNVSKAKPNPRISKTRKATASTTTPHPYPQPNTSTPTVDQFDRPPCTVNYHFYPPQNHP
jgi:hypothetical protein